MNLTRMDKLEITEQMLLYPLQQAQWSMPFG